MPLRKVEEMPHLTTSLLAQTYNLLRYGQITSSISTLRSGGISILKKTRIAVQQNYTGVILESVSYIAGFNWMLWLKCKQNVQTTICLMYSDILVAK